MEYTYLGRTGLKVSRLCLGTMNFGNYAEEAESHEVMDMALAEGINFFDTANVYGWNKYKGLTEEIIGTWFAKGGGRRERVVLATKVHGEMGSGPNDRGLSARHIKQAVEASLKRLQTDYIDLYQMHHVQRDTPWEEIWQAMEQLVREGKVLYVGSSNFAGWNIAQAQETAQARSFMGLVSEQPLYNLVVREAEMELLPACEHYGLGVIPWSPINRGTLAGALKKQMEGRMVHEGARLIEEGHLRPQLEQYEAFCDELGHHPASVALAWLLTRPAITAPIIGPRTKEQFAANVKAVEIKLGEAEQARLLEIFPGPGPSPEAYAW